MTARTGRTTRRAMFCLGMALWSSPLSSQPAEAREQLLRTNLQLDLDSPQSVMLGEPIELVIGYRNAGREPLVLNRGLGIGASTDLRVSAIRDGCQVEVPDAFIEAPMEWTPFFQVPLIPGRALEERLRFNDVRGTFIEFPIRVVGTYDVSVALVSAEGGDASQPRRWTGTTQSSPRRLTIMPARQEAVAEWRDVLRHCLSGDCTRLEAATKFFSLVRDDGAADHLSRLLGKAAGVVHALAAQGRKRDVVMLRNHARAQVVPATRDYYLEAAARIERDDPCW
jgi:hypothetical protein